MLPDGVVTQTLVRRDTYRDSVELMRIAAALEALPGIARAAALMATPANCEIVAQAGFDSAGAGAAWSAARPSDLLVSVQGTVDAVAAALALAEDLLNGRESRTVGGTELGGALLPRTLRQSVERLPGANLSFISVPGPYAASEALKALKHGLHVFCFSDNVAVADEVRLKRLAVERGLLVMGPDCGTAVIDGVPLGFANVVRRGPIGLVGASGTGLQEVMCLLDRAGSGVSQVIGVGSHDLSLEVGGIMMRAGLRLLGADPATEVIVAISKPPDPAIAAGLLADARATGKPVVVCFLGTASPLSARLAYPLPNPPPARGRGLILFAATLEAAAELALRETQGGEVSVGLLSDIAPRRHGGKAAGPSRGEVGRRSVAARVVGLFSGGTLCSEAAIVLQGELAARNSAATYELLDLGDDRFTVGRPHPMIDPRDRAARIQAAGLDPTVAVILLDVVLGYGAHHDPAGALEPAISAARSAARNVGREIAVVASITGTAGDPQGLDGQRRALVAAGALLAPSNAAAARLAASLLELPDD